MGPGSVDVPAGVALPSGRPPAPAAPRGAVGTGTYSRPASRGPSAPTAPAAGTAASAAAAPAAAPGLLGLGDEVVETHVDLVRHLKRE